MKKTIYSLLTIAAMASLSLTSCSKKSTPTPAPTVSTYTITLQPGSEGVDASINSLAPSNNNGNVPFMAIEAWTQNSSNRTQRSLIDFDYSSIPSGATITSAMLTLYADTSYNYSAGSVPAGHSTLSGSNSWYLSPVTSAWDEQTVTWNTMPSINASARLTEAASTSASQSYSIDITSFVKQEIANPTAYYGFMLSLATESPYRAVYFYSSDGQYSNLHPKLVIQYTK